MAKLNNTDGFILHGWMVNELHLRGGELIVFAVVNQFSQSDAGIYKGGVPYLCLWTGWSANTIRKYLRNLEEAGLIKSERGNINGVPFCHYKSIVGDTLQNLRGIPQDLQGEPSKFEETTLQNLSGDNNKKKVKRDNKTSPSPSIVHPSVKEVAQYAREKGFADPDGFAAHYVEINNNRDWINKKGEPIIVWKNNILNNWMNRKSEIFATGSKAYTPKFTY